MTVKIKRLVMRDQPEVCYVAGYGIGRAGYPKEWTPLRSKDANKEDWERWRQKAIAGCRWKNLIELVFDDGKWTWLVRA